MARRRAVALRASTILLATVTLPALASPVAAQESATLAGVVLDDRTGTPVASARISLQALGLEVVSDVGGQFLLDHLPTGTHEVRFDAPGYVSVVEVLELSAAEFLQMRLTPLTAVLDEILVLTGRPRRADEPPGMPVKIDGAPWRTVLSLLEDQVPGVIVRRRGALGAGAAIYLRGVGTFQSNAAPDVYLDGVRIDSATNPDGLHVLDVMRADEVARVRVFKGAAAGAARGGANGTILIETHRGTGSPSGNR